MKQPARMDGDVSTQNAGFNACLHLARGFVHHLLSASPCILNSQPQLALLLSAGAAAPVTTVAAPAWIFRYGEQDARWVAYSVWNFSVTFSAEDAAKLAAQEQAVLFLGGVDTFGTVSINGQTVLQTNNFHR
jgi:hypothetical protein